MIVKKVIEEYTTMIITNIPLNSYFMCCDTYLRICGSQYNMVGQER